MPDRRVPTVPQRVLAAELERRRIAAGLDREDVARALEWSVIKPYRIETTRSTASPGDVRELARLYRLNDTETEALVALARQARRPGWWKGFSADLPAGFAVHLELESSATAIRTYEAQWVPGLFQTEDYARAVMAANSVTSTPEQVERQVQVRMRRQQILTRTAPPPPQIWAILDEAVIRRVVGGRAVMRDQLRHLLELSGKPSITMQVLPFSAGAHMAAYGSFTLFDPSDPGFPATASTDRRTGSLIEDDPEETGQYTVIFDHLRATALNPGNTRELITETIALLLGEPMPLSRDWVTSSYSTPNGGNCVQARRTPARVQVRDSKDPRGPVLTLTTDAWTIFTMHVKGR